MATNYHNVITFKGDLKDIDAKLLALQSNFGNAYNSLGESAKELNPELLKNIKGLDEVGVKSLELKSKLQSLKDSRGGILKGTIESDIDTLKEVQTAFKNYQTLYKNAKTPKQKAKLKPLVDESQSLLLKEYNTQVTKLKNGVDEVTNASKIYVRTIDKLQKSEMRAIASGKEMATTTLANKNHFNDSVMLIGKLTGAYYAMSGAIGATIGRGHTMNKLIENETIGMKLLIAQNLQNVDVMGRSVTAQQKFAYAQKEANKAIDIVRKVNVDTPHNLGETLQVYKLLVPQVLKYGGTLEDVGIITKNVSVVGKSMGVEFENLVKTVDSLMSGEMKESGLQRAMAQFGISQKEVNRTIKEGGDVVELFIDKLKQVAPAAKATGKSWDGVTSHFTTQWDSMWATAQKPLFDRAKNDIASVTEYMKKHEYGLQRIISLENPFTTAVGEMSLAWVIFNRGLSATPFGKILAGISAIVIASYEAYRALEQMQKQSDSIHKQQADNAKKIADGSHKYDSTGQNLINVRDENHKKYLEALNAEKSIKKAILDIDSKGKLSSSAKEKAIEALGKSYKATADKIEKLKIKEKEYSKFKSEITKQEEDSHKIAVKRLQNEALITKAQKYNKAQLSQTVKLKADIEGFNKEIARLDTYIAESKNEEQKNGYLKTRKTLLTAIANKNKEIKSLEKVSTTSSSSKTDTKAKELREQKKAQRELAKAKKEALTLDLQSLKIEKLRYQLGGGKFSKLDGLKDDLVLLQKQSKELYNQKDINNNTIKQLEKKIAIDKEIEAQAKKAEEQAKKEVQARYELDNLNLSLLMTNSELNNTALSRVDILKKELEILHSIDGQAATEKDAIRHKIEVKNKELEISREIKKSRKAQSDWEQREADISLSKVSKKYDAELRWQELIGNDVYVENAKYEKMAYEFREAGVNVTSKQIKEQIKLNEELNRMRGSLAQIIDDMMNGATLADGFSSLVEQSTKASIYDFSDQFSKAIASGFDNVDYEALGESAGIALANMMTSQIVANNQDSARQRDGTAIGGGIGTAVGSYYGGSVGGAVGGTIGSFLGGEIAGGERKNYIKVGGNGNVSARQSESGGWFHNNTDKRLDRDTTKLQLAFEATVNGYEDVLNGLLDSTDAYISIAGTFSSDLKVQQALNEDFFRKWVGIPTRVTSELLSDFDADAAKKYFEDQAGVIFESDAQYKKYLADEINKNVNGIYHGISENYALQYMRDTYATIGQSADNVAEMEAKAKELELAWENYAEATDQSTNQAITSILGNLDNTSIKIDEYALRADEDKQKLLAYRAENLKNKEKKLEDFLGYGDVTLENFQRIYDEASRNADLTPEQAIKLNQLGDVLLRTGANADDLKSHIDGLKSSFLTDRTAEISSYSSSILSTEEKIAQLQASNADASSKYAQDQLNYTNKITSATRDMISTISKTFEDEIDRLIGIGKDDETQKVQNLIKFNDLEQQYRDIVNGGGAVDSESLKSIQSEMIGLSNTLGVSENTGMSKALINALSHDKSLLDSTSITASISDSYPAQQQANDVKNTAEITKLQKLLEFEKWLTEGNNLLRTVNDDFAVGYSKSHELSRQQANELYEISKDGDITQEELRSLNSWSSEMVNELRKEIKLPEIVVNVDVSGNITVDRASASFNGNITKTPNPMSKDEAQSIYDKYLEDERKKYEAQNLSPWTAPSFDGGGFTGTGSRSGGVDGIGGFNAILHPNEMVFDLTKMNTPSQNNVVFIEMLNELKAVKKELEELKDSNLKQEKQATITSIESRKTRKILEEA